MGLVVMVPEVFLGKLLENINFSIIISSTPAAERSYRDNKGAFEYYGPPNNKEPCYHQSLTNYRMTRRSPRVVAFTSTEDPGRDFLIAVRHRGG